MTVAHSTGTGRLRSQYSDTEPTSSSATMNQSAGRRSGWPLEAPNEPTTATTDMTAGNATRLIRAPVVGLLVLTLEP